MSLPTWNEENSYLNARDLIAFVRAKEDHELVDKSKNAKLKISHFPLSTISNSSLSSK